MIETRRLNNVVIFIQTILEVDIEYPDELRNLHNYYPLSPKKL